MWKLIIVSFSCMVLISCGEEAPVMNPKQSRKIKYAGRAETQKAARKLKSDILLITEKSARKTAQEIAEKISAQAGKNVAEQIASASVNQAIQNMEQKISRLLESEMRTIKEMAVETASTTAKKTADNTAETAEQIASASVNQAIQNMEQKISRLLESEIRTIKEMAVETASTTARKTAGSTAKKTAEQIASASVNQAIQNMEQRFSNLSESEIQTITEMAVEAATTAARETADNTAEKTAAQIASASVNQAIQNMKQRFSSLSESEIQTIKEMAVEAATTAARETAGNTAGNTAAQIASASVNQAIQNMEQRFSNLSESEIQTITEMAIEAATTAARETAGNTAKKTAAQIASASVDKASQDMEQRFSNLSESEIQAIKEMAIEAATTAARETADNTAEKTATQIASASVDKASQDMEQRFSNLLKAGLRTIVSAAIEAATTAAREETDHNLIKDVAENAAAAAAREAAGEIAFDTTNQSLNQTKRRFSSLPFEECHWTNHSYTTRIVKEHGFFPLSDPLKDMLESWKEHQNSRDETDNTEKFCDSSFQDNLESSDEYNDDHEPGETDTRCALNSGHEQETNEGDLEEEKFAYLSPLYDDFILYFFQESIHDINLSENDVPLECFFASAVRGASIYNPGRDFYYCEKNSNRPGNMSVTDNNEKTRIILPRRACLNKNYMYLTARAFNKTADCFGFGKSEKESIFNLFHHESSFLHNIKSPTGARCYGQLTIDTIKEINKQIYFRDAPAPLPYSYIFDEVIDKCPGLQNAVLNSKISESVERTGRKTIQKFNSIVSRSPVSCKITQNPYSCLFYAFYNIKKNSVEIEAQFHKPTSRFGKKNNIPMEFKERFLLPIRLDSMVGVTSANGKDMIFWDDSELWLALKERPFDSLSNIRKLPLFENEEEVMELFNFWTYNGGISVTLTYMTKFIKQLKRAIAAPCPPDSATRICQYRRTVSKGRGLATADIKKDFQAYIQQHYQTNDKKIGASLIQKEKRRKEVTNFVSNVTRSVHYLYNERSDFKGHLKALAPKLEDWELENFQDHLKNVCPKP